MATVEEILARCDERKPVRITNKGGFDICVRIDGEPVKCSGQVTAGGVMGSKHPVLCAPASVVDDSTVITIKAMVG